MVAPPSNEDTFAEDIDDLERATAELKPLAEKVWRYCEAQDVNGKTVTVKIKCSDFTQATRSRTATVPFANMADVRRGIRTSGNRPSLQTAGAPVGRDAIVADQRSGQCHDRGAAATRSQPVARTRLVKTKSLPREEVRQAFRKEPNSDLGGGVPLFRQTSLGGGVGRLKVEALREEVHRFDRVDDTPITDRANVSCCTAAMQGRQV